MKIILVLVSCNSIKEADKIGMTLLKKRLIACYDITNRLKAAYHWPPKSGKIETAGGALLIMDSLSKNFKKIEKIVEKLHSDKTPFIGSWVFDNISKKYYNWVKGEVE